MEANIVAPAQAIQLLRDGILAMTGRARVAWADRVRSFLTPLDKCGQAAAPFIPRWGMSFACVLPKGHEGEHKHGGSCVVHGDYVGEKCPNWPNCVTEPAPDAAKEQAGRKMFEALVKVNGMFVHHNMLENCKCLACIIRRALAAGREAGWADGK